MRDEVLVACADADGLLAVDVGRYGVCFQLLILGNWLEMEGLDLTALAPSTSDDSGRPFL